MLTLSIIIPVYNEERHIRACLDAIAAQTHAPTEVIIVDNNCSDRTLEIAESYDFVKIVRETRQGRGYARSAGFDATTSDIIGRIDADSILRPDWVKTVLDRFGDDSELTGITGLAYTMLIPYVPWIKSTLFSRVYYWFAHAAFDTTTMWGANMAFRRSYWPKIQNNVILDDTTIHEDQDLSLWLAAEGAKIEQDNAVLMTTDGQSYSYLPKLYKYFKMYEKTKIIHKKNGNLKSPKVRKLGFFKTFPGRLLAIIPTIYLTIGSILLFPVDYMLIHTFRKQPTR